MSAEAVPNHETPDRGQNMHLAERPRDGELWHEMMERQKREGNPQSGYQRELLRSLPDEQKEEKTPKDRGDVSSNVPLMDAGMMTYRDVLREASRRGGQEHDRGIDR